MVSSSDISKDSLRSHAACCRVRVPASNWQQFNAWSCGNEVKGTMERPEREVPATHSTPQGKLQAAFKANPRVAMCTLISEAIGSGLLKPLGAHILQQCPRCLIWSFRI
jgi:hypothetical protein